MSSEYTAEEIEEINTKARDELYGEVAEEEEAVTDVEAADGVAAAEDAAAEGAADEAEQPVDATAEESE